MNYKHSFISRFLNDRAMTIFFPSEIQKKNHFFFMGEGCEFVWIVLQASTESNRLGCKQN